MWRSYERQRAVRRRHGGILAAAFGNLREPGDGEAVVELPEIPDGDRYKVVGGVLALYSAEELAQRALARQWADVRAERNRRLYDCDWTQGNDSPLTGQEKQAWKDYRQALRDVPQDFDDPGDVVWPTKPWP